MKRAWLLLFLLLGAFAPARAPETCGIFKVRQNDAGLWELEVGCDSYTAWIIPDSLKYDPEVFYPQGLVFDDGTFVQEHLRGCLAEYGCDPTGDGVRVEKEGQVQYVGFWQVRLPVMGK